MKESPRWRSCSQWDRESATDFHLQAGSQSVSISRSFSVMISIETSDVMTSSTIAFCKLTVLHRPVSVSQVAPEWKLSYPALSCYFSLQSFMPTMVWQIMTSDLILPPSSPRISIVHRPGLAEARVRL